MDNVKKALNKQVANFAVLYIKLHNYHWFVKGNMFYTLHEKFEELYDEVTGYYDEVAERLLMIGGSPAATMKEYLSLASIQEASGNETTEEMVQAIVQDFETVNAELAEGIKVAADASDEVTVDLFVTISKALQKNIWMLKTLLD
ncbi:MAG TPA: DNA starvation/stationary phase protection protein [Clostridiales bacterium]|jgi:starvation-inducible DNA-binding protein|nr:DNA starvation/stationary phase protection protein [Clostridiales bacterium]